MFFCIPLVCGVDTKLKPDPSAPSHGPFQCPRCRNTSLEPFKRRQWFSFFWIPLVPFKAKHILFCGVCQYSALAPPPDSTKPTAKYHGAGASHAPPGGGQAGYNVEYVGRGGGGHGAKV